jgi:hypothetical protein
MPAARSAFQSRSLRDFFESKSFPYFLLVSPVRLAERASLEQKIDELNLFSLFACLRFHLREPLDLLPLTP